MNLGCKINKITHASYTIVSLQKFRKWTFQNRLRLWETDINKIQYLKMKAHIDNM